MSDVYRPVSLGSLCETKYELVRKLYFQEFPKRSPLSLRGMMGLQDHGARTYGWNVFDWQYTPTDSVIHYLENDFEGVFERKDLFVFMGKEVRHRLLHTNHFHDFEGSQEWSDEKLDMSYPAARARFDKRVVEFRKRLQSPGPYLYVHLSARTPEVHTIQRLLNALSRHPEHRFHLLLVAPDADSADLSPFNGKVSAGVRSGDPEDTPPLWSWWGEFDEEWDRILSRFSLTNADPDAPPAVETPLAEPLAETTSKPRGPGLLRRILGGASA